jgi:hypothetical protein
MKSEDRREGRCRTLGGSRSSRATSACRLRRNRIASGSESSRPKQLERASPRPDRARPIRLENPPVEAEWDPELTAAMIRHGLAVHEEHMLDELLGDLGKLAAGKRGGSGLRYP